MLWLPSCLVDTDVYSYITSSNRKRGEPYKPHLQGHTIALSFITIGEQYYGYRRKINKGEWAESRIQMLETGFALVAIVPYDIEVCRTYGKLRATLLQNTVSPNDLWIAACAVRHSLTLVTNNRKHFDKVPGLVFISRSAWLITVTFRPPRRDSVPGNLLAPRWTHLVDSGLGTLQTADPMAELLNQAEPLRRAA
jgi:tRNA(fMet)-specific endonuclease VapC